MQHEIISIVGHFQERLKVVLREEIGLPNPLGQIFVCMYLNTFSFFPFCAKPGIPATFASLLCICQREKNMTVNVSRTVLIWQAEP